MNKQEIKLLEILTRLYEVSLMKDVPLNIAAKQRIIDILNPMAGAKEPTFSIPKE